MKSKVRDIVEAVTAVIREWPGAEAAVLQHYAEKDIFDPGFSVSVDVFRRGAIPDRSARQDAFPGARYFESALMKAKDRFLVGDLPVRISYKDCARVDALLGAVDGEEWLSMERGTYLFHRLATGTVVWSRGPWIDGVLKSLDALPPVFWSSWKDSCRRRLDHMLGDLGAAVVKGDALYFHLSLSGFLRVAAEALCAVNGMFEPGPRDLTASLDLLEVKPDGFAANWDSLLRDDGELPPDRKREVASLLANGVLALLS